MESLEEEAGLHLPGQVAAQRGPLTQLLSNEHRSAEVSSNERLEFLGDSVLGFVTAEFLFKTYGKLPEGDLTRIRAALVCEQSLYEVAKSWAWAST